MATASSGSIVPTKYWHETADGRIQCDLCPRFCKLREGQRVSFDEGQGPKGPRAENVRPL